MFQATINTSTFLQGVGVHTGNEFSVTLRPAEVDAGIVFVRKDQPDEINTIAADFRNVSDTNMCTTLSNKHGLEIRTIEHLMAALYAMNVSNVIVEVSGGEIPILDGSSARWIEIISQAGVRKQSEKIEVIKILRPVKVENGNRWASFVPFDRFSVKIECDFASKGLRSEQVSYDSNKDDFIRDFTLARTFGFISDVEYLKKNNMAQGASLENTVVFNDHGEKINEEPLRYEDEPARHKLLDVVGDLALSRFRIQGKYESYCPGHQLNNLILKKLFEDKGNCELIAA